MKREYQQDLILVTEAARIVNVSSDTIRVWERTGQLPAIRASRVRIFLRADVERLARERAARKATAK